MNRVTLAAALLAAAAGALPALGQCSDPRDTVICVHTLTAQEEAQFSSTDGTMSAFWGTWASHGYDSAYIYPPDYCYPGQCNFVGGATDAALTIKAAGSARGLYLYLGVQDNIWVDRANATDIGADATDMFLDELDAQTIWTCTDCKIGLYSSLLSFTTNQFQVWMGATTPPADFQYQYYDGSLWTWTALSVTWAQAKQLYGFEAEVVTVDATHKAQEWFLPWVKLGAGGVVAGTNIANRKFGFTGGYNDKDGDNANRDAIRWTGKDPWVGDANYWGNLLIGADMPLVVDGMAVQGVAASRAAAAAAPAPRLTEYYTLSGQRLSPQAALAVRNGGATLRVSRFADGSSKTEMMRFGR